MQPGAQDGDLQRKQRFPLGDELLQGTGQNDDLGEAPQILYHSPGNALGGHLGIIQLGDELLRRNDGADIQLAEEAAEYPVAYGIIDGVTFTVVQVDEVAHRGEGGDGNTHREDELIQFGKDRADHCQRDVLDDAAQQDGPGPWVGHGDIPGQQVIRYHNGQQQQQAQWGKQPHKKQGIPQQEPPPTGPAQEIVDEAADRQQYKQKSQRCKLHGSSLLSLVWWVQDPGSGAPRSPCGGRRANARTGAFGAGRGAPNRIPAKIQKSIDRGSVTGQPQAFPIPPG